MMVSMIVAFLLKNTVENLVVPTKRCILWSV